MMCSMASVKEAAGKGLQKAWGTGGQVKRVAGEELRYTYKNETARETYRM